MEQGEPPPDADPLLWWLGQRVRAVRMKAGLSQRELATDTGMRKQFLNRVENGRQNLNIKTLWRIAVALGRPLADLLEGVPPTVRPNGTDWEGVDPRTSTGDRER